MPYFAGMNPMYMYCLTVCTSDTEDLTSACFVVCTRCNTNIANIAGEALEVKWMVLVHSMTGRDGLLALEALCGKCYVALQADWIPFSFFYFSTILTPYQDSTFCTHKTFRMVNLLTKLDRLAYNRLVADHTFLADFLNVAGMTEQAIIELLKLTIN